MSPTENGEHLGTDELPAETELSHDSVQLREDGAKEECDDDGEDRDRRPRRPLEGGLTHGRGRACVARPRRRGLLLGQEVTA